jgi:subtilisin family serine protease
MRKGSHRLVLQLFIAITLMIPGGAALAKSARLEPLDKEGKRAWIIELADPPLARFDGKNALSQRANAIESIAPEKTGKRLDLLSPKAVAYGKYLDERIDQFLFSVSRSTGEVPAIKARFKNLINGVALRLTETQADRVRSLPGVKSLIPNEIHHIESDAGPELIGASKIWTGQDGLPSARGEGVVIGIVDTGINWDHESFSDPAPDGYNYSNPLGQQLGLCNEAEVLCNDKLIGVYDYTNEGSMGKDTVFHGSLVSSIAAGNRVNGTFEGVPVDMQGVAPRANIISYKVCQQDDPNTEEDEDGCASLAIAEALEQALTDGVDVVNLSVGGGSSNPWHTYATLFLDLRNAGIFAATSAGNSGPEPETATNPALAPWLLGVAAATHTRFTGALLKNLTGGNSSPPEDLAGEGLEPFNGSADGIGPAEIVFADDYGYPLCGTGVPADSVPSCDGTSSATNPFEPGTFNGEIVVCKRGDYGRVEKGFNVMLAGAGGYILINSEEFGESLVADQHCVPGIHMGYSKGKELESWLTSGSGHTGTIGPFGLSYETSVADVLADFSSRGPNQAVPGTLVPNITAPGVNVVGAGKDGNESVIASGTSFASPFVAGGGALLLSIDPDLTPSQLQSMLQTTATTEVRNHLESPATPFEMGSGRIQLDKALEAGLYMHVSGQEFLAANPATGGDPGSLNLPGMVNESCQEKCSFSRTVTDLAGGGNWTASAENFPAGVLVNIVPANFSLSSGGSQTLEIEFVLAPETIGEWIFGEIMLASAGLPDQHLTAAVTFYVGVPSRWNINSDMDGGWKEFQLKLESAMPDATFTAGGLVKPGEFTETLKQDPSRDDPFDNSEGVMTQWFNVPEGTLWFHNRTPSSTANDLDLFVGRDVDGDGFVDQSELLCESITDGNVENCDILSPAAGDYWVLVQNFDSSSLSGDEATLISAVVGPSANSNLAASGPGITGANEPFDVRLSWDNVNALPGELWLGAVSLGTNRDRPGNVGIIPVYFNRTDIAAPVTFPLMDGTTHSLALAPAAVHDRVFIDVPPGARSLNVTVAGATETQSNNLKLELVRLNFDDALDNPPFASGPGNAPVVASATGGNGNGPSLTVSGGALEPGRWYAVLSNQLGIPFAIDIRAKVEFSGAAIPVHAGLWEPGSRPGLGQGYEYSFAGPSRALIWYTYDEDGQPVWFIADNPNVDGNIWTADLLRVTNDGSQQQLAPVGQVSVSLLAENDAMFSFTLYGESGTDRMQPLSALTCPELNGSKKSYTGLWYRGTDGLGGASVLMNSMTQAQIHYLFDDLGMPRWLFVQDLNNPAPTNSQMPMLQFSGYCAVCAKSSVTSRSVGVLERSFSSENTGSWTLDYLFESPLSGSVERTDQIIKLTDTLSCE